MPKPGPISAIEADPEFATFDAETQARILADAQAARRRRSVRPARPAAPAQPSAAQQEVDALATAKRQRTIGMAPQGPATAGDLAASAIGEAVDVARSGVTASMLGAPNAQAMAEYEATKTPEARALRASRAARAIPTNAAPRPSAGAMAATAGREALGPVVSAVEDVTKNGYADPRPWKNPTFGQGVAGGAGAIVSAVTTDPVADAALGAAGLAAKPVAQAVTRGVRTAARAADRAAGEAVGRVGQAIIDPMPGGYVEAAKDMAMSALPQRAGRPGSIKIGRPAGPSWDEAAQKANKGIEGGLRELAAQQRDALDRGDTAMAQELASKMQQLDDARVIVTPRPRNPGNPASVQAARYYNPTKYNFLNQDGADKFETMLTQQVAEMRAAGQDPRTRVTQAEVSAKAREILPFSIEQTVRRGLRKGDSLNASEYEAAKNFMQQRVEDSLTLERELNDLTAQQALGQATPEAVQAKAVELHQTEKDIKGLAGIVAQSRSQKGRDLAYLKMVAQQGWDTGYWTARAERVSGGGATPQQMREIQGIVVRGAAADQAGDQAAATAARIDLAKAIGKLEETPFMEALLSARKAGLLTGMKTIARNSASNTLNIGAEELVNALGSLPDVGMSMLTGQRTTFMPTPSKVARGLREVRTTGIREFGETMQHGMPLDQLAAMEIPREVNSQVPVVGRVVNAYANTILRFQGAQDRIFKAYAMRRSLDDQAQALAFQQLGRGNTPAHRALAAWLREHPTTDMQAEAAADAAFATFQNETAVSEGWASMKRGLRNAGAKDDSIGGAAKRTAGRAVVNGLDLIVPFVKTPTAIASKVIDMAILPVATGLPMPGTLETLATVGARSRRIRAEQAMGVTSQILTPAEQKAIARGFGRGMIGSSLIWLGGELHNRGLLTGSSQPDQSEEQQAAGRSPGAIKAGDRWMPLNPFSPVGNLLVLGATLARDGEDSWHTGFNVWKTLLDQPFTQGAKQLVESLNPGEEGASRSVNRLAGSIAGSVVPTIVSEFAQATDPSGADRGVNFDSTNDAIMGSVAKRLPGTRENLPIRTTALGDPVDAANGLEAFAAGAGKYARENDDTTVRELLTQQVALPRPRNDVKIEGFPEQIPLTQQEQADLWQRQGNMVRQLVDAVRANPDYLAAPPEAKRAALESAVQAAGQATLAQFLQENRSILASRAQEATDADLRARGRRRAILAPMDGAPPTP